MSERTAEQIIKERWPDAVCYLSAYWRGYVVMKVPGDISMGNILCSGSYGSPAEAWADAAERIQDRKLSKAERAMYGCDG